MTAAVPASPPARNQPLRVLIVDDSADDAALIARELQRGGYHLAWQRPETADAVCAALAQQPWDLVIADYSLPHFSAPEALQMVQESGLDLPFVVVSGSIREDAALELMRAGAHDVLPKGNLARLIVSIERALREARIRRDRLQVEEALRRQRDFAESLIKTAQMIVLALDTEGRIVRFNPYMEEISGYRIEEVEGQDWFSTFIPQRDLDRIRALFAQAARNVRIRGYVNTIVTKSGNERYIEWHATTLQDAQGNVVGVLSVGQDVTERKQSQEALVQLAAIVESSDDAIIGRTLDGTITSWNAGAQRMYGYSAAEAKGQSVLILVPPERHEEVAGFFEQIRRGQPVNHYETVRVTKDGRRIDVSLTISPIRDAAGNVIGASTIARDITEQRRAQARLRELEGLSRQRERLADIGAITAQIVHDLGNPLAGISLQAQLILRRIARAADQPIGNAQQPAERILAEVRRLDALVKEFMEFSREQRLHPKAVQLPRFLQDVVGLWQPVASARQIALTLDLPNALPSLTADEELLRRVFENLVKNAVEAIDHGPGRIYIRAAIPDDEKVRISVEDTGPGIAAGLQPFHLFETTKPHGTGLGLAIVRQIVLAHGGHIEFAPREPHGTVFHVELPFRARGA